MTEIIRANDATDRPIGLTPQEAHAYVKGYADGCMQYAAKHGIPSISIRTLPESHQVVGVTGRKRTLARRTRGAEQLDVARRVRDTGNLRDMTIDYEWARHPHAHRAGLLGLKKYRERQAEGLRLDALAAAKRGAA